MKKPTFTLLFSLTTLLLAAQNEGNIWYFGPGTGLDFNTCTPTVLNDSHMDGFEGCATICDKTSGQLLFYTNSDSVWNSNRTPMPNGDLIVNTHSNAQVLIIPKPLSDSLYYIFTTENQANNFNIGFRFHTVDMSLNNGLGDVIQKDSLIYAPHVTEEVTAVRHANGTDIWVIGHECGTDTFFVFLVTSAGVSTTPVINDIGKNHRYDIMRSNLDAIGQIKASPDGRKLAVTTFDQQDIELFDFDNSTGIISNQILLTDAGSSAANGNFSRLYGVSFSPNNAVLYASAGEFPGTLMQFDISSGNAALINNSKQIIYTGAGVSIYDLKLARDGKIYTGGQFRPYLGVINNPNNPGVACNFVYNGIYLNGNLSGWGLNNLIEANNFCEAISTNDLSPVPSLSIYPNPFEQEFNFTLPGNALFTITITDCTGKNIYEMQNATAQVRIVTDDFVAGVYLLQAVSEEQTYTAKLIRSK
jgi:hypothetical protein